MSFLNEAKKLGTEYLGYGPKAIVDILQYLFSYMLHNFVSYFNQEYNSEISSN